MTKRKNPIQSLTAIPLLSLSLLSLWVYVRVLQGPNRAINGVEGWVNSDYLDCAK